MIAWASVHERRTLDSWWWSRWCWVLMLEMNARSRKHCDGVCDGDGKWRGLVRRRLWWTDSGHADFRFS